MKNLKTFKRLKTFEVSTDSKKYLCAGISVKKIRWFYELKNIIQIIEKPEIDPKTIFLIVL